MRFAVEEREVIALDRINLNFPAGSITTVVGRSGCGKTTLLRLLAGLELPTAGTIRRDGTRRLGYVFQEPRLMPWQRVRENVAFGLAESLDKSEGDARIALLLEQVGLSAFANAYPDQLSGGMASRVAIARALAPQPDLLLMDEPFAALDAFTRRIMQNDLVRLWQQHRPTMVFITHDVEEAVLLGERVVELADGRLVGVHHVELPFPREVTDPTLLRHRRMVLENLMLDTRIEETTR
jgi:sulfonate transport system ATP-binding protein